MITLALPPIVLSLLLAGLAPRLVRDVSGRVATLTLTAAALTGALSTGLVLSAIGCLAVAQWTPFAAAGHWSTSTIAAHDPLPYPVDFACGVLAIGLMAAAAVRVLRSGTQLVRSARLCRRLAAGQGATLTVLDTDRPEAYALAGLPGRTVVTRGMLRALSGPQRRALLAHERSHVDSYHFVYVALVELAATADPLLRPLVPAVRLAVERWADDAAAAEVSDRGLVATTLARAGLARSAALVPHGALGAAIGDVSARVDALVAPSRSTAMRTALAVAATAAVIVGCVASSGALGLHLHNLIEWAQAVRTPHR